jgi:peroxiredoxin
LPPVNRLYAELRPKGLEVLLVSFREDPDHVRRVVRERGYVAPVLLDRSGDVAGRLYGVWGPPTLYLVDREGRLLGRAVGGGSPWDAPRAREALLALLEARPGR